ncbi:MAG: hypothetical protein WAU01_14620 [Saprospiraceae bacterium]
MNNQTPEIPEKFKTTEWMKQQFGSAKLANELRSGNYINYMGKPTQCTIQTIYAISKIEGETAMYMPIPLTEEWLVKFWFEKGSHIDGYKVLRQDCFWNKESRLVLFLKSEIRNIYHPFVNINDDVTILKYVHQLQNLYFALTAKELTLSVT